MHFIIQQKDFEKSLTHLQNRDYKPGNEIRYNLLLTKLYYELIISKPPPLIDSFRHLIDYNNLMSDDIKKHFYNYLKHYKRLLEAKQNKELDST
jgi:hypothetical protein